MKDKPDQISGFKKDVLNPYGTFVSRMEIEYPELIAQAMADLESKAEGRKRKWDAAVGNTGGNNGDGFSFGFGGDESDEEIP